MTISRNFSVMAQGASTAGVLSPPYGGALQWQAVQTTSFAAVAGRAYFVNTTSGAVTVTLPRESDYWSDGADHRLCWDFCY